MNGSRNPLEQLRQFSAAINKSLGGDKKDRLKKNFRNINHLVVVGSIDGICTAAAFIRMIGNRDIAINWTQAFTVDKIDPWEWESKRKVAFINLGVNFGKQKMTADFVQRVINAGHKIVAVCDEHSSNHWHTILGSFADLLIEPRTQGRGEHLSSGIVLYDAAKGILDPHGNFLCFAANNADAARFVGIANIVSRAIKSDQNRGIDNTRRDYLAKHLAFNLNPDMQIQGWMDEYSIIEQNHAAIIEKKRDLRDGICLISIMNHSFVDMSALSAQILQNGVRVVLVKTMVHDEKTHETRAGVMFFAAKGIYLPAIEHTLPRRDRKITVFSEHTNPAIETIRAHLKQHYPQK